MRWLACLCCLLLFRPVLAAPSAPEKETPAEKLRKALDQTKDLHIPAQALPKFAEVLGEQTGIPFTVDPALAPSLPVGGLPQFVGLPTVGLRGSKLRIGPSLSAVLAPHGLIHVILGDKVLISTMQRATHLVMRQRISITAENVVLEAALRQLARSKGVNIVLDPQVGKEKNSQLNLRLSNVSLEAAVQVVAASSGLQAVRLGDVLFVTTPRKATALHATATDLRTPLPAAPAPQFGMGGGGLIGGVGAIGVRGNVGVFGNLGGQFGIAGGGAVGLAGGGGIMGIPAPRAKPKKQTGAPGKAVRLAAAALFLTALAPVPQPVKPTGPRYHLPVELRRLQAVITIPQKKFDKIDDPSFTFGQLLNALSVIYSRPGDTPPFYMTFEVNRLAFKAEGIAAEKLLATTIAEKQLPEVINVSLADYLRRVLDRCPGSPEFILRRDKVEITTRKAIFAEFYHDRPKKDLDALPPLVNIAFDRQPLDVALQKLAGATEDFNVVLNGSLKEAKTPVSATFRNVPLDTAVWTLADMAGLDVVRKDNLLYVTRKKAAPPQPSTPPRPALKADKP